MSSAFVAYSDALIRSARFVLLDGRSFVLEAMEVETGRVEVKHIPGTPQMSRNDMDKLAQVVYYYEEGRVAGGLTRRWPAPDS